MAEISSPEIGTRYDEVADADVVMSQGQAGTVIALLKAILLQITLLAKAGTEPEQGGGA